MNVCGIGLILLFFMINKIRHQWGKFVSLEKKKKQFGIITLQQHVHRFTALEKNIIFSNRMAKELHQIRLWRTRYLRVRICMHSPWNIYRPTDPIEKKVYVTEN